MQKQSKRTELYVKKESPKKASDSNINFKAYVGK